MWDRIRGGRSQVAREADGIFGKPLRKASRQPLLESLEERRLPTASLQPIANLSVPAQQGYTQPLLANTGATTPQTFTVTSSNPDIAASIATGPFWSVGVSYTDPSNPHNDFTGTLSFQLFQNLTPNTVSQIEQFTNDGYYVNEGKYFPRIVPAFSGNVGIVQGGANNEEGTGSSGQPGTPFSNEIDQQLAFTGSYQLAMANAGGTDTNDTQFFVTNGALNSPTSPLPYNYTIFGQMLTGQSTITDMMQVPLMINQGTGETPASQPENPITISSATLSSTNPNGVLIIDTTQAKEGESATITVTAHDADGTTATETFTVTVTAYNGPNDPVINFRPFASPVSASVQQAGSTQIQLSGVSGYPDTTMPSTLSYALVSQPAHGTITNFNASTGTLTYTAQPGYLGVDSFQYVVNATGPESTPAQTTSNPTTVTLTVGAVDTGAVQVIGPDLVIQPLPKQHGGTNYIEVNQVANSSATGGSVLEVYVNGQLDSTAPGIGTISEIIAFGGRRTNNYIVLAPNVTVPATIDSGHGKKNALTGGGAETREHGWSGYTTLIAGPGPNQLIGLAGHVKFKPNKATTVIFEGQPKRRTHLLNPTPPGGTFYKLIKGRLVPVASFDPKPKTASHHKR